MAVIEKRPTRRIAVATADPRIAQNDSANPSNNGSHVTNRASRKNEKQDTINNQAQHHHHACYVMNGVCSWSDDRWRIAFACPYIHTVQVILVGVALIVGSRSFYMVSRAS